MDPGRAKFAFWTKVPNNTFKCTWFSRGYGPGVVAKAHDSFKKTLGISASPRIGTPYIYTTTGFGPRQKRKWLVYTISWCICKLPHIFVWYCCAADRLSTIWLAACTRGICFFLCQRGTDIQNLGLMRHWAWLLHRTASRFNIGLCIESHLAVYRNTPTVATELAMYIREKAVLGPPLHRQICKCIVTQVQRVWDCREGLRPTTSEKLPRRLGPPMSTHRNVPTPCLAFHNTLKILRCLDM